MKFFSAKTIAAASLLLFSACAVNPEAGKSTTNGVSEVPCDQAVQIFTAPTNAVEPNVLLTSLPVGHYAHTSAEIYIQNQPMDGSNGETRVQYLETPTNPSATAFTSGIRCKEVTGTFRAYSENPTLITDFSVVTKGLTFDVTPMNFALNFSSATSNPTFQPQLGNDSRSTSANTFFNTITGYWNAGYKFVHLSGSTYAFYGTRVESDTGRTIYGKANYTLGAP
jgi:hypothetical protein